MNNYEMLAESYEEYLRDHPDASGEKKQEMNRKIKAATILGGCTKEERAEMFDIGAFQEIAKGYYLIAIENADVSEETKSKLRRELRSLFRDVTAMEAESYYFQYHSV